MNSLKLQQTNKVFRLLFVAPLSSKQIKQAKEFNWFTIDERVIAFFALLVLIFLISFGTAADSEEMVNINLTEGINYLNFSFSMKASQFMGLNENITVISFFDSERNKTIAYVNLFGGLGKDFIFEENVTYEIFANSGTELNFLIIRED